MMFDYPTLREEILCLSPLELARRMRTLYNQNLLREFLGEASNDRAVTAHISYWEKWYPESIRREIDQAMRRSDEVGRSDRKSLPLHLEEIFSDSELKIIFSSLGAVQLSFGCSKNCPLCGIDAVPNLRESLPFPLLRNMFRRFGSSLADYNKPGRPILYWASDPSDYQWIGDGRRYGYQDVHALAKRYAKYDPHITTKEYSRTDWLRFLRKVPEKRLSVHGMEKLEAYSLGITVTPSSQQGERDDIKTSGTKLIGIERQHSAGMGVSILANKSHIGRRGIGCFNGLLLTPRGLYNLFQVPISSEFPQGHMVVPLERISPRPIQIGDSLSQILREKVLHVDFIIDDQKKGEKYTRPVVREGDRFFRRLTLNAEQRIKKIEPWFPPVEINLTAGFDGIIIKETTGEMPDAMNLQELETVPLVDLLLRVLP